MTDTPADSASTTTPDISIVMPTYNRRILLERQIRAVRQQESSARWELVVVDNGSTDDTAAYLRSLAVEEARLRYVSATENSGAAYARNVGADRAAAALLAFVDDDDVVGDGWLEALFRALQDHDFVASRMEYDLLNRSAIARYWWRTQETELSTDRDGTPLSNAAIGIRRNLWMALGGQRSGILVGEDVDLSRRAAHELNTPAVLILDALYHRQLPETLMECLDDGIRSGRSRVRTSGTGGAASVSMSNRHTTFESVTWLLWRVPYLFGERRFLWARRCGQMIGALRESWRLRSAGT